MAVSGMDRSSRWLPTLIVGMLGALVITALVLGQVVFIPLALAIVFSFLLQPFVQLLERGGLGRVPAVLLTVAFVAIVFAGIGWSVGGQLQDLARQLRTNQTYIQNLESKVADLRGFGAGGVMEDVQATLDRVGAKFGEAEGQVAAEPAVVLSAQRSSPWSGFMETVGPLLEPLGTAAMAIVLVIFILIGREDLRNRLIGLLGYGQLSATTHAFNDAGRRIGKYLLMQFILNASYGLALGFVLFLVGVPFALLWGFMSAILRYIPYVGPLVGVVFPVATSLVAFEGWTQPLVVIAFIVALELFSNMVMEPLLYGQSVGISAVALISSAALWTLLWGPIGLVLATPLTVCLLVLGQYVREFRFFVVLLGDEPALPSHVRYYQRLLARDRAEALALAQERHAESNEPCDVFDQVLVPAILRTRRDHSRNQISAADEAFVWQSTQEIIAELAESQPKNNVGLLRRLMAARVGSTNGQAVESVGDANGAVSALATDPSRIGQATADSVPRIKVLGCAAHHKSEELAVSMLASVLPMTDYQFQTLSTKLLPSEILDSVREQRPDIVFLAVIPPSGRVQASYLCRLLRKSFPDLPIVVGYWGSKKRFDEALVKFRSRGASFVTTSILQSQKQIAALADLGHNASQRRQTRERVHATHTDD